jgi:hypothetical protein
MQGGRGAGPRLRYLLGRRTAVNLFGLAMMAMAQESDLELLAIATGDVDASGSVDVATLYSTKEGDLVVELSLGYPEKELPAPISPSEGPTLEFFDTDGDKWEDLLVTMEKEEVYAVRGIEHQVLLEKAREGEGDQVPDSYIALRKPAWHPINDLIWGLGDFVFCDWDRGCYPDDCANACSAWEFHSYICDVDDKGNPIYCHSWDCVAWKMHCI